MARLLRESDLQDPVFAMANVFELESIQLWVGVHSQFKRYLWRSK